MREQPRVLILGGTATAYDLAQQLVDDGHWHVLTSLAGRTRQPRLPAGNLRIGGFGGIPGFTQDLRARAITAVIDATHRFAAQISRHAVTACRRAAIPYLRLQPLGWRSTAHDRWRHVGDERHAARLLKQHSPCRVLLALGYQHLSPFKGLPHLRIIVRTLNPDIPLPLGGARTGHARRVVMRPGPALREYGFLRREKIDLIVARNSGGLAGFGKIQAARRLAIPVMMIDPPRRAIPPDMPEVQRPEQAVHWLVSLVSLTSLSSPTQPPA